jgi:hypothetical protein
MAAESKTLYRVGYSGGTYFVAATGLEDALTQARAWQLQRFKDENGSEPEQALSEPLSVSHAGELISSSSPLP